jgi:hypothetical protein
MHQLIALGGKVIIRQDLPNGGTREAEICPYTRRVLWWRVNGPNEEEKPVGGPLFNSKISTDESISPILFCSGNNLAAGRIRPPVSSGPPRTRNGSF